MSSTLHISSMLMRHVLGVLAPCLLVILSQSHCAPTDPCTVTTISSGELLYGFPPCATPDTKQADLATVMFDPEASTVSKDVMITVRALYGTVTVSITETTSTSRQQVQVPAGVGAQSFRFTEVKGGNFTIQLSGDDGYTKWQVAAFAQPTGIVHDAKERESLKTWADACCPDEEDNVACSSLHSWADDTDEGAEDACDAEGNMCNADGRLVRVQFAFQGSSNAFSGCLSPPPVLQNLTALRVLNLTRLGITWPVQELATILSKLPDLEELVLDGNAELGGVFYMEGCVLFNQGKKLRSFSAVSSNVSGQIPPCMFNSPQLEELNLYGTAVSGELPTFGADIPLMYFNASAHDWDPITRVFTGTIPAAVSTLTNLAVLALNNNQLQGSMPDWPTSLEILVLQNNRLSGSLPQSLYQLQRLKRLHLENNQLSGPLDPALGKMSSLEDLWLTGNSALNGSIDFEWTARSLQSVHLSSTQISGAIPAGFATSPNLRQIIITGNRQIVSQSAFAEALPDNNSIVWYDVSNNSVQDFPEGLKKLGAFTNFKILDYTDDLGNYVNYFDVSNNKLSLDPFPVWLVSALPNSSRADYLMFQGHVYTYNIAGDPSANNNRLVCPRDRGTAQAASRLPADLLDSIHCSVFDDAWKTVTLKEATAGWSKLPYAPPPPPLQDTSTSQQPTPTPDGSFTKGLPAATTKADKNETKVDDLGLILGCAFGATVVAGVMLFLLFKYVLRLRRKSYVEFKDGVHNNKHPGHPALSVLGDSHSGDPVSHSPAPVSDPPVPNKTIQEGGESERSTEEEDGEVNGRELRGAEGDVENGRVYDVQEDGVGGDGGGAGRANGLEMVKRDV